MDGLVTSATPPVSGPSDAYLVARAASGDLRAFGMLVERHRSAVFRAATRLVGPGDADDVVQDAFLRAYHRLDRLRRVGSFRAWLMRIVEHAALDTLERRRRVDRKRAPEEDGEKIHERTPARLLEEDERRRRLTTKLQLMRPEHRLVLVLRDVEGWSYEEIAIAAGIPLGTVKGRLHRARGELIEVLRANAYDWELPDGG